jgi:RNA dependent RNA polymerase
VEGVTLPPGSPLLYLSNCICFSQKGERDLPSKLSGRDLDGDLYNIIWDSACKPTHTCIPADYPRQVPQDIGREVTREDMTDFFIKFMETDQLGRIATSHQVLADQRSQGTSDPDCKMLAELHSTAVDFSETGIPVNSYFCT